MIYAWTTLSRRVWLPGGAAEQPVPQPGQPQPGSDPLTVLPWGPERPLKLYGFHTKANGFVPAHLSKPGVINAAKENQQQQIQVYYGLWIPAL